MDLSKRSYMAEEPEYGDRSPYKRPRLQSSWLRQADDAHPTESSKEADMLQCRFESRARSAGGQQPAVPAAPSSNGQSKETSDVGNAVSHVTSPQCPPSGGNFHAVHNNVFSSRTPNPQLAHPASSRQLIKISPARQHSSPSHHYDSPPASVNIPEHPVSTNLNSAGGGKSVESDDSMSQVAKPPDIVPHPHESESDGSQSEDEEQKEANTSSGVSRRQHSYAGSIQDEESESSQDSAYEVPELGKFETDLIREIAEAHADDIRSIRSALLRNQSEKKSQAAPVTAAVKDQLAQGAAVSQQPTSKLVAPSPEEQVANHLLQSESTEHLRGNDAHIAKLNAAQPADEAPDVSPPRLTRQIDKAKLRRPNTSAELGCTPSLPKPSRLNPKDVGHDLSLSTHSRLRQRKDKISHSDETKRELAVASADDSPDETAEALSSTDEVEDDEPDTATKRRSSGPVTGTAYLCPVCSKSFSTLPELSEHLKEHPPEKGYQCKVCAQSFGQLADLERHCRVHTGKVQTNKPPSRKVPFGCKPYPCTMCERRFHRRDSLTEHMRKHTGEKPHVCTICNKHFARKSDCTKHTKTHLPVSSQGQGDDEMIWDASYGPRVYRPTKHIRGTPYDCQYCDKTFTQKGHLDRHTQVHTGEKPFVCSWCKRTFAQKGHLQRHEITHTGIKNFKCMMCDKWFAQGSDLTRHSRTHTGERPYVCNVCDKAFSQAGDLARHMGTHKKKKPFQCIVCEELFVSHKFLLKHLESHGPEALQHAEQMKTLMGEQTSKTASHNKPKIPAKFQLGNLSGVSESDGDNSQPAVYTDSDTQDTQPVESEISVSEDSQPVDGWEKQQGTHQAAEGLPGDTRGSDAALMEGADEGWEPGKC